MPNWLSAAKRAFQNQPPREPERYEIRCGCETAVTGVRTRIPQQVTCPGCAHTLLVFPESIYPTPKPLKPKPAKSAEKSKGARTGASKAITEPLGKAQEAKRASDRQKEKESSTGAPASNDQAPISESTLRKSIVQAGERLTEVRKVVVNRRHFTPLRMVVLLMCVILGLTGYWMVRRREREQASQTLIEALKAGRKAIDEDDIPNAGVEYRRAVAALDVLGQADGAARATRQTAGEISAINGLADKPLRDLLAEAAEAVRGGLADSWPETFRINYHNAWVVVDAVVTPIPVEDPKQPTEFLIDLPVASGENQLLLKLHTREMAGVARDGKPRRLILAAQLENCVRDSERPGVWRLELDGKSPFLWTDVKLLERIGWPRDAVLEKLLEEQAQLAGIER